MCLHMCLLYPHVCAYMCVLITVCLYVCAYMCVRRCESHHRERIYGYAPGRLHGLLDGCCLSRLRSDYANALRLAADAQEAGNHDVVGNHLLAPACKGAWDLGFRACGLRFRVHLSAATFPCYYVHFIVSIHIYLLR